MSPKRGNVRNNNENTRAAPRLDGHHGSSGGAGSDLSASQFASSNSTVNTFLGGKQKSWMIQGSNGMAIPVTLAASKTRGPKSTTARNSLPLCERTNPTPSLSTPLQQPVVPLPTPQPPSNSTSPLIANTLHPRQAKPSADVSAHEVVLPSPAPSEEAFPDLLRQPETNPISIRNEDQPPTGNKTPPHRSVQMTADPQSQPDLGKELEELLSRYGVEEVEKFLRSSNGPQSSSNTPTHSTVPVELQPSPVHSTQSASLVPHKRPSLTSMAQEKRQRLLTVPSSHQIPAGGNFNTSLGSSVQSGQPVAYNNQPTMIFPTPATQGPSLMHYLHMTDKMISDYGGESALGPLGLPRIRLLQDACKSEDCFYLTLHQVYCLHSMDPQSFFQIPGMSQIHVEGLGIVEQLVLSNQNLPPNSLAWFASFPAPHTNLVARSPMYQRALKDVQNFLYLIAQNWRRVQEGCRQRDYPPIVEELVTIFGLVSIVFQRVVFTAIHRSMWGPEQDACFRSIELLFRQDQQNYQEVRSRMNTARPPTAAEIRAGHIALVNKYKEIRQQRRQNISGPIPQSLASTNTMNNTSQGLQHASTAVAAASTPHAGRATTWENLGNPPRRPQQEQSQMASTIQTPSTHFVPSTHSPGPSMNVPRRPPRLNIDTQPGLIAASAPTVTPHSRDIQPAQMREQARILAHPNTAPYSPATLASLTSGPPGRSAVRPRLASQPSRSQPTTNQPLIPRSPFVAPLQPNANPTMTGLHQAHLRSPTLHPIVPTACALKLYSVVRGFLLSPKSINQAKKEHNWSFSVSESEIKLKTVDLPPSAGAPAKRGIREGSHMFRLRCAKVSSAEDPSDESKWVVMENVWPSHAFVELNSSTVELRRKQQHGKDLPADLTPFVSEGVNRLKLCIMRTDKEKAGIYYAVAVEVVEVITGDEISEGLRATGHLPAKDIVESIKASLSVKMADEDIAVVNSNITIQLSDPFTARIFDTPVRSKACLHRECFDLDTFLQTRKSKRPEWPCMPDEWKCPICGSDARPQALRVDGFLLEVRKRLAKQGLLETRAIVVEEDGSWQPKAEKNETDPSGRASDRGTPASNTQAAVLSSPKRQSVVIDLEDD